ncbi:hypothetical protein [Protaetiibacter intestinalis]|uniref:Uncharacterized protein n=1 Tax=Protaetiibacter intestinalis TaxID=2419774 RepID=A0A387BCZ3_9MICO|nr:hypothetical protein [Protaetiibacter intestinalis]AYF98996.1 hypothetical protein D7I47_12530 [Protaetiibacter intestinalis]
MEAQSGGAADRRRAWRALAKRYDYRRSYAGWSDAITPFVFGLLGVAGGVAMWFGVLRNILFALLPGTVWVSDPVSIMLPIGIAVAVLVAVVVRFATRVSRLVLPWARWERRFQQAAAQGMGYAPWEGGIASGFAAKRIEYRDVLRRPDGALIAERHTTHEQRIDRGPDSASRWVRSISRGGWLQVSLRHTYPEFRLKTLDETSQAPQALPHHVAADGFEGFALWAEREFAGEAIALFTPEVRDAIRALGAGVTVTTWNETARISIDRVIDPDDPAAQAPVWRLADALLSADATSTAPLIPDPVEVVPLDAAGKPLAPEARMMLQQFTQAARNVRAVAEGAGIPAASLPGLSALPAREGPKRGAGLDPVAEPTGDIVRSLSGAFRGLVRLLVVLVVLGVALYVAKGLLTGDWTPSIPD